MEPDPSVKRMMDQLREGDPDAQNEVYRRFVNRLIALARSRMDRKLRQKVDPEDVAQSALKSFFLRQKDGQFEFDNWEGLWGLLVKITLRKCNRKIEHFYGPNHDLHREVGPVKSPDDSSSWSDPQDEDPTPLEIAALADLVEQVMKGLKEREQKIFNMRLQGFTVPEIAREVGRTEHTVHLTLRRIKDRLRRIQEEQGP